MANQKDPSDSLAASPQDSSALSAAQQAPSISAATQQPPSGPAIFPAPTWSFEHLAAGSNQFDVGGPSAANLAALAASESALATTESGPPPPYDQDFGDITTRARSDPVFANFLRRAVARIDDQRSAGAARAVPTLLGRAAAASALAVAAPAPIRPVARVLTIDLSQDDDVAITTAPQPANVPRGPSDVENNDNNVSDEASAETGLRNASAHSSQMQDARLEPKIGQNLKSVETPVIERLPSPRLVKASEAGSPPPNTTPDRKRTAAAAFRQPSSSHVPHKKSKKSKGKMPKTRGKALDAPTSLTRRDINTIRSLLQRVADNTSALVERSKEDHESDEYASDKTSESSSEEGGANE